MSDLIEIGHWATAEITELDKDSGLHLIITDETLNSVHLPLESARRLFAALQRFDSRGLLSE